MKDRAIELARQVGAVVEVGLAPVFYDHAQLHRFYQLARNDGVEAAEKLIKSIKTDRHDWEDWPRDSREAFKAFKDAMEAK